MCSGEQSVIKSNCSAWLSQQLGHKDLHFPLINVPTAVSASPPRPYVSLEKYAWATSYRKPPKLSQIHPVTWFQHAQITKCRKMTRGRVSCSFSEASLTCPPSSTSSLPLSADLKQQAQHLSPAVLLWLEQILCHRAAPCPRMPEASSMGWLCFHVKC